MAVQELHGTTCASVPEQADAHRDRPGMRTTFWERAGAAAISSAGGLVFVGIVIGLLTPFVLAGHFTPYA